MRYETSEDLENNCITLTDNKDELTTSFDSEIILYPLEDAVTVVDKLKEKVLARGLKWEVIEGEC